MKGSEFGSTIFVEQKDQSRPRAQIDERLAKFGLHFNDERTVEENKIQMNILEIMQSKGFLEMVEGQRVVDTDKLKGWGVGSEGIDRGKRLIVTDLLYALQGLKAADKKDLEANNGKVGEEMLHEIVVLPQSSEQLKIDDLSQYLKKAEQAMLQPWEFGQRVNRWVEPIHLQSGENSNRGEIALLYFLHKWQAQRGSDDKLTVVHPKTGKRVRFSPSFLGEFAQIRPSFVENGKHFSFDSNSLEFTQKYFPNLIKNNALKNSDFRIMGGRRTAEIYNVHERRLNPKAPFLTFTNPAKQTAKYYIGRGKIPGTDYPIDDKTMKARQLDSATIAIVKEENDRKEILFTFNLLGEEESSSLRNSVKKRLEERKVPATPTKIADNSTVGEKRMRQLIRQYSIADFLPARPGENPADYYKRIRPLDNVEFVADKVQKFFQQAEIGVHNLPWAEQLVLSRALLEKNDEEKLLKFAKTYGLAGVRSFLSLDYERTLGPSILEIGQRLDKKLASEIFAKYSEIVDAAGQAQDYVQNHISGSPDSKGILKIKDQLLKKGKDLLLQMAGNLKTSSGQLGSVQLLKDLASIKGDILLFAGTFKAFSEEQGINLSDVAGTHLETKRPDQISPAQKEAMRQIFADNRKGYSPSLLKETQEEFEQALNSRNPSQIEFHLLLNNNELVSFIRFDELTNGNLYSGSMNVRPEARGSAIGSAMLKATLDEKAKIHNIEAVCYSKNPMLKHYTGDFGFEIVGEEPNFHGTGELYYKLFRPKAEQEKLAA